MVTLNINEGHNERLMEDCQILKEYAQYVARVRNYKGEMDLDAAVERAVKECIHEGILEQFLRENRAEVIAMSIFEYDQEEEERKLRKAEFEAGVASGIERGIEQGKELEKESGIRNLIDFAQEIGSSPERTKLRLQEYYNLSSWDVKKYMEKFWENYVEDDSDDTEEDAVIGNGIFRYVKEEEERKLRKAEFEAGVASGIELEKEVGIRNLIHFAHELGLSQEKLRLRLMECYKLSEEAADDYTRKYWEGSKD